MNRPDLYHRGKRIELTKRIGKGGEGEVYRLPGEARKAVKIYTGARDPEREAKVKAMVQVGLAQTSNLVAFPEDIVTARSGEFAGFIMRLVEGFRPVHELYGPKSRKIHYPKADYRFLVRAATNTARAVGQVHGSKCIIGDLNESGILVSHDATVALIDADSFQLHVDSRTYHCLVGKPEFTPPELQGGSLKGVVRTHAHDNFGLGVAIFQLLFMGRHPYAGRQQGSDLTLDPEPVRLRPDSEDRRRPARCRRNARRPARRSGGRLRTGLRPQSPAAARSARVGRVASGT